MGDSSLKIPDEIAKVFQCFRGEVLGRRCVLLDAFQVLDRQEGLLPLLINDSCESIILLLNFLDDFLFDALLLKDCVSHVGAICEGCLRGLKELLELIDLVSTGLLESHTSATTTVIIEKAVIAERHVANPAVSGQ